MNRQTLIILGGGLVAALIVALLMQALIGSPEPVAPTIVEAPKPIPQSEVLVASRSLEIGSQLSPGDMKWQKWPTDAVFDGAITRDGLKDPNANQPLEGRLRREVVTGEPLMRSALVEDNKGNFIAATLSEGMRAVAIKINAESSAGGFVKPGDMVDVLLTYVVASPSDPDLAEAANMIVSRRATQTIMENIKVMAVDQHYTDSEKVSVGKTVTVEVSPEQSEELALASEMGTLSLALRKIGDNEIRLQNDGVVPPSITDFRLSNVIKEVLQQGDGVVQGPDSTIKIYSGNQVHEVTVESFSSVR